MYESQMGTEKKQIYRKSGFFKLVIEIASLSKSFAILEAHNVGFGLEHALPVFQHTAIKRSDVNRKEGREWAKNAMQNSDDRITPLSTSRPMTEIDAKPDQVTVAVGSTLYDMIPLTTMDDVAETHMANPAVMQASSNMFCPSAAFQSDRSSSCQRLLPKLISRKTDLYINSFTQSRQFVRKEVSMP
jgi:hypothetical protein